MQEKRVTLLDIPIDAVTLEETAEKILEFVKNGGKHQVCTPNPEMLLEAQKNPAFRNVLQKSSLNIPDGIGLILFSKLKQRVTGVDVTKELCKRCRDLPYKIFLLGAMPGVAEMAADRLQNIYPSVKIVGCYSGSPKESDEHEIRRIINEKEPDILLVAYGAPAQELWINRNLPHLHTVKVAMGVGGAFDFIAGIRARAPKFMQTLGLEWLWRLAQEPKRIKRIFNAVVRFPYAIIVSATSSSSPESRR